MLRHLYSVFNAVFSLEDVPLLSKNKYNKTELFSNCYIILDLRD